MLDVDEDWLRVEYERAKPGALVEKETVVQLIDARDVACVVVVEAGPDREKLGEDSTMDAGGCRQA